MLERAQTARNDRTLRSVVSQFMAGSHVVGYMFYVFCILLHDFTGCSTRKANGCHQTRQLVKKTTVCGKTHTRGSPLAVQGCVWMRNGAFAFESDPISTYLFFSTCEMLPTHRVPSVPPAHHIRPAGAGKCCLPLKKSTAEPSCWLEFVRNTTPHHKCYDRHKPQHAAETINQDSYVD